MSNLFTTWGDAFNASVVGLWDGVVQFVPYLFFAIVLFIIGWILGVVVAKAIEQVFTTLKVDNLLKYARVDEFFKKAGMNLNTGYFVGQVVKWFVIIVFLIPSLELVKLNTLKDFLQNDVLGFLPKVVIAAVILIVATIVADGLSKTASASARTMGLSSANMLGAVVKYAIWIFALVMALGQLGFAQTYMESIFGGVVQMASLGLALALGLGGKDTAAKFIGKISDEVSKSHHS